MNRPTLNRALRFVHGLLTWIIVIAGISYLILLASFL